jgi:hypothetical protein
MDAPPPELELHQALQRFATLFVDRVTQATETLERAAAPEVRDEALRKNLLYASSALEIATGPFAEVNVLDMVVFVRLCRAALERHFLPHLYGEAGRDLAAVFERSAAELSAIADRALDPARHEELDRLIDTWLEENPQQARVEGVRFADFAAVAGSAAAGRAGRARGLLESVKHASRAADEALLLGERAVFLVHRLPTVWRLQSRLGVREITGDLSARLVEAAAVARRGAVIVAVAAIVAACVAITAVALARG